MRRFRGALAALVLVAPAFTSVLASPVPACAAGAGPRAALVVDTGTSVSTYCVALGSSSVDGLELIRLAGRQHGLTYSFGFGGQAVCSLAGVGPAGDDCFAEHPDFWGYWRGDGSGGWSWSGSGAGGTSVEDGDVEGWAWGAGDSGSSHPAPPGLVFHDVCAATSGGGSGDGGRDGGNAGGADTTGGGDTAGGVGTTGDADDGGSGSDRPRRSHERARRSPSPSATESAEPPTSTPSGEPSDARDIRAAGVAADDPAAGPPMALYAAAVVIAALVGGGWLRLRRRGMG